MTTSFFGSVIVRTPSFMAAAMPSTATSSGMIKVWFAQGVLGWPVYTRPEVFEGKRVPEVLLSGHHKNISEWRRQESLKRTQERRPDILEKIKLNAKFGDK